MRKWRLLISLRDLANSFFPGRHDSKFKSPHGLGIEGVHPLGPGDDFASLDLIRYILSDEDYAVERPSARTALIYFFLDQTPSMDIGWGSTTRGEAQERLLALFIRGLADEGNQIGIGAFTDTVEFMPRLKSGKRALRSELENALERTYHGTRTDFAALSDYLFSDIPSGALVFVTSDWEGPTLSREVVEDMNERVELIPVVLLHRFEENERAFLADTSVVDSETVCGAIENDHHYRMTFEEAGVETIELFIEDTEEQWMQSIQAFFQGRKQSRKQRMRAG